MKKILILIYKSYRFIIRFISKNYITIKSLFFSKLFAKCWNLLRINWKCRISWFSKIYIWDNVHIWDNIYINADWWLVIWDNTHLSRNIVINTSNHNYEWNLLPYNEEIKFKKVSIGKNVWIWMNVVIAPWTIIWDWVIIWSGTSVAWKVPNLAIVWNTTKIIKYRDKNHYDDLETNKQYWWISWKKL